jgi:uncharacterized membrane protein
MGKIIMNKGEIKIMTQVMDKLNKIDKAVAVMEEHLRNQNGKVDWLMDEVDTNSNWRQKVTGGMVMMSILLPTVSVVASFFLFKMFGGG